jgi:formamidopyrimidine-DNA glycosylase
MPELPEVETIINDLKKAILRKKIAGVDIADRKVVGSNFKIFQSKFKGNYFIDIERRGKLIIFYIKSGDYLLVHLKMTGQLIYCDKSHCIAGGHEIKGSLGKLPNKYTRVFFKFSDSSVLYFNDLRRFGYLKIAGKEDLEKIKDAYGVEPLSKNFTIAKLKEILKDRKRDIKQILMNQALIAGIGNIYADEILFAARIRPTRSAGSLKKAEIKNLYRAIGDILKKGIKYRGTTFSDYLDSSGRKGNFTGFLRVYGHKTGEKCFRCPGALKKIKIGGRSSVYCPSCQK